MKFINKNSTVSDLCLDVGCGTGFVTRFELPQYDMVVAIDISRRMLEVVKRRFKDFQGLNLLVCDAENLPFRDRIANMVSVSSVLHHLPQPYHSLVEISRVLKKGGLLYITREPNDVNFRRFFDFLDGVIIRKLFTFIRILPFIRKQDLGTRVVVNELDYPGVDIHYPTGFNVEELSCVLSSFHFEVIAAYSYHWIYPTAIGGFIDNALSRINFLIEQLPFSKKLGRFVCLVACMQNCDAKNEDTVV